MLTSAAFAQGLNNNEAPTAGGQESTGAAGPQTQSSTPATHTPATKTVPDPNRPPILPTHIQQENAPSAATPVPRQRPTTSSTSTAPAKTSRGKKAKVAQRVKKEAAHDAAVGIVQPTVKSVEIKGNRKIEKDAILARVKSKVGDPFSQAQVHDDVLEIYNLGYFYNIKVDKEPAEGGVKLIYDITEKPSVAEIVYNGHSELSEDDLKEAAALKPYEILDIGRIQTAVQKMEKVYEDKGYFLASVKYSLEDVKPGETVKLIFDITENEKVRIRRISFLGNRNLTDKDILDRLRTSPESIFSSGSYKQETFDQDVRIVQSLYFNRGFVQVKVDKPEVTVTPDKRYIYITMRIEEGDQFNVGEVDFSGDLLFSRDELFEAIKIQKAGVFSYETLLADINTLQAKYGDLGYAFANILPRTALREKEKLVDITFDFDKGNKVYLGEINVVGNTKTRDKVVRREMKVRETELYNETRKRESLANIKRLGFFDDVQFNQKSRPDDPAKVDMDIAVKERNTGSIQVGAGYSSYQGFVFNGQIQQANFLGRGQKLGVSVQLSSIASMFDLNFTEPYFLDSLWSVGADLYQSTRQLIPYQEIKTGGALRFGHPLAPYLYGFIRYKNDVTQINLAPPPSQGGAGDPNIYPVATANGRTSSLTWTLEYDKRNDRQMPSDGYYGSASIEYAGPELYSEKHYTKGIAIARYYHELFWGLIYRTNATYGFITSPDNGGNPPFNELFLLGGANSLRGFQWFTVGEQRLNSGCTSLDPTVCPTYTPQAFVPFGGKQEAFLNNEIEFPLVSDAGIRGVFFYDVGQADNQLGAASGTPTDQDMGIRSDVGFGFRWFSPIGPLRFEWGFPLDLRAGESPVNFEFAIGSPF